MNRFIKKINTLPLIHQSFVHKPFILNLLDTFHIIYRDLDLESITYTTNKDRKRGVLLIEENLKNAPNDIKKWCIKHFLYDMNVFYTIKGKQIQIVFSLFSGYEEMLQTYLSYIPWILHWFTLAYHFSEKKCSYPATLFLYLTPFKKMLPEQGTIIEELHANTAYTWKCKPKNKIIVFRQEEWFKVLIHESFHFFNFEHFKNADETSLKHCFPLYVPLYIGEAYGEFWARVLNCFYCAYFMDKQLSRKSDILNHFYRFMYMETMFSCYQAAKVLKHINLTYEDLYSKTKEAIERRKQYKEKTNVFCYYILTAVLMNEYPMVLSWCYSNNNKLFNMELKHSQLFVELVKKICKTSSLQHNLSVLGDVEIHDKSLRMTLIDFL